jgi:hypothetical protein
MMPAGKYYIGDLCYVMHEEWDDVCDTTIVEHQCLDGEFKLKDGPRFAAYGTQYGDGFYYDQNGNGYAVDAGLIGCIRVEDIHEPIPEKLACVHEFKQPFRTGRTPEGTIYFGNVKIETGDIED